MTRSISPGLQAATNAQESAEVLLPIVKLSHASWAGDVRLVANHEQLTHAGEVYLPWAFEIALPDDEAEGLPVLQWVADNVDRQLTQKMRGVTDKITARVAWVLASTPDVVEAGPFDVEMVGVEYDAFTISGGMTIEPILDEQFGFKTMTPSSAPGLF